jgi:hypothetical protein
MDHHQWNKLSQHMHDEQMNAALGKKARDRA